MGSLSLEPKGAKWRGHVVHILFMHSYAYLHLISLGCWRTALKTSEMHVRIVTSFAVLTIEELVSLLFSDDGFLDFLENHCRRVNLSWHRRPKTSIIRGIFNLLKGVTEFCRYI